MSYIALARKWRPRLFSELIGQDLTLKALTNAFSLQRIHHAYLFSGTRGIGKTSVARIIAKSLNCETGISATPCLTCDTCLSIEKGTYFDLIEIDGASKTKVEDTRELLDSVQYAPTHGRFKIYLIDEVHMLSQHSFNALLKTLEEPPAHIKFLLATTDPHKLPTTILSRCLQFNLKPVSTSELVHHIKYILSDEAISFEEKAVELLAKAAMGSVRDALTLLDQAISLSSDKIYAEAVRKMLGFGNKNYAKYLLEMIHNNDATSMLTLCTTMASEGVNVMYVVDELLECFHQLNINQCIGTSQLATFQLDDLSELAKSYSKNDIQLFYQIVLKGKQDLHLAPNIYMGFEMLLLRLIAFNPVTQISHQTQKPNQHISENHQKITHETSAQIIETMPNENKYIESATDVDYKNSQVTNTCDDNAVKDDIMPIDMTISTASENIPTETHKKTIDEWPDIIKNLTLSGLAQSALLHTEMVSNENFTIVLRVDSKHQSLFTSGVMNKIKKALSDYYQHSIKLELACEAVLASPAMIKERGDAQSKQNAEQALKNDSFFNQIVDEFSAEILQNSITSSKDGL